MDVRIQPIHFEVASHLVEFINKKADKLARRYPSMSDLYVIFKVVKPETAKNKEIVLRVTIPQFPDSVATKTADSFEEALDLAIEAVERQLEKNKEKK